MKTFLFVILLFCLKAHSQEKIIVTQKGWLIYLYGDKIAFLPIKDQTKTPTYKNFFSELKGDGQKMTNNYSAPPKLLLAKKIKIDIYDYDSKMNGYKFVNRSTFYIQPVNYVFKEESSYS